MINIISNQSPYPLMLFPCTDGEITRVRSRTGFPAAGDRWHICELSQYGSSQYESPHSELPHWEGVQSTRGWFTADFSVHDDKPLECLNKIFFGQNHREPRHGEANKAIGYLHTCRPEPEAANVKSSRKKCYLDILGEVFRTEKTAVKHPRVLCTPSQCGNSPCGDSYCDDPYCDNSHMCYVAPAAGKPVLDLTRPDSPHLHHPGILPPLFSLYLS